MNSQLVDMTKELRIQVDAITNVCSKDKVKLVQWIYGSSYSEHQNMIRLFGLMVTSKGRVIFGGKCIRQCYVMGFIEKELKSIVLKGGHKLY